MIRILVSEIRVCALCISPLIVLILGACNAEDTQQPLLVALGATLPIVLDADGDGDDEFVWNHLVAERHSILHGRFTAAGLKQDWQLNFPPFAVCYAAGDLRGTGAPTIFVTRKDSTSSWIEAYSLDRVHLLTSTKVTGLAVDDEPGWDGSVIPIGVAAMRDGRGLVAALATGYDLSPRGVAFFAADTGRLAWIDSTASYVKDVRIADLDGNGSDEIVYTTHAVGNGSRTLKESDDRSSVTVLGAGGGRLAHRELGHVFSRAHVEVANMAPAPGLEIAVTVRAGPRDENAELILFDATLAVLAQLELPGPPAPHVLGDVDGDGISEILLGHDDGSVLLVGYDGSSLVTRGRTQIGSEARPAGVASWKSDRCFVACGSEDVWFLDNRLRVRGKMHVRVADTSDRPIVRVARLPVDLGFALLMGTTDKGMVLEALPGPPPPPPWALILMVAAFGVTIGSLAFRRRRATVGSRAATRPTDWKELLLAASNLGHRELAMATLTELACRIREGARVPALIEGLDKVWDGFLSESAGKIERLTELALALPATRSAARDVATRLGVVRQAVTPMADGDEFRLPGNGEAVADEMIALAESAEELRNDVVAIFDCDVQDVVEESLTACRADCGRLPVMSLGIICERDPSGEAEPATIWPADLRQVLCDLIRNAVEAMRHAPEPRLEINMSWGGRSIAIRVTDNGRGMPSDRWEAALAGESSKGGRGSGLANARETLASYRGRLCIERSAMGEGTTVLVEVPRRRSSGREDASLRLLERAG